MIKSTLITLAFLIITICSTAQQKNDYYLQSPDGKTNITISTNPQLQWSVSHENTPIITPSSAALQLSTGEILGTNLSLTKATPKTVSTSIPSPFYKKANVIDHYNELTLQFKGGYGIIFRAYNDGVAYRHVITRKGETIIANEKATFNFSNDHNMYIPYVRDLRNNDRYMSSYEALYDIHKISQVIEDSLAFLPLLVDLNKGKKVAILEAHLENYPGMYIVKNEEAVAGLKGHFAPYPTTERNGGFNNLNYVVDKRGNYIAKLNGQQNLPWRAIVISSNDAALANNDIVYRLAAPLRISDASWIKPGKVAWDWWNDWNITGVDFKAGINTLTYKHYIDFAAANKIEYIIMDEGWSETTDIMKVSPRINLEELISYGKQKGVDIILWATWYAIHTKMEEAFAKYSAMGIKGFKIDFLDRDDQKMTASTYAIAKRAADYKLLINYHGVYKPEGLQRTYPNVINFEGVKGLENAKWTPNDDVPGYDVTIPYIRMLAGPMDYTPGAMRNATKSNFRAVHSMPMSQGTRCHQLAMYTVFEAPLQMLADNPSAFKKEQESTQFIAQIPTTFDETQVLDGKVGEYIVIARRKGDTWYIGALTNWTARDLTLDFSFLGQGTFSSETFSDGINADRDATDYKREQIKASKEDKKTIHLASGGGWAAIIKKTT